MALLKRLALTALFALASLAPAWSAPKVVVTVAPVHALVAQVMAGVGQPSLLLPPGISPHDFALKPSQARLLSTADLVVWIGSGFETVLEKPLHSLAREGQRLELAKTKGLIRHPRRAGDEWESHDDHGHSHHHHHEGGDDPHYWLDPDNAKLWLGTIADTLAKLDPPNAATYRTNAKAAQVRLDDLTTELAAALHPIKGQAYVVFHDAYQYFERRFGLRAVAAVAASDARRPSPRRIARLRRTAAAENAVCLFTEPQMASGLADTAAEGLALKRGQLDPIGADIAPGPKHYETLLRHLTRDLRDCLKD